MIQIDMLTKDSVSIAVVEDETITRKAYINSVIGRKELSEDLEQMYVNEVIRVWGNTATVEDIPQDIIHADNKLSSEERLRLVEAALDDLLLGGGV